MGKLIEITKLHKCQTECLFLFKIHLAVPFYNLIS